MSNPPVIHGGQHQVNTAVASHPAPFPPKHQTNTGYTCHFIMLYPELHAEHCIMSSSSYESFYTIELVTCVRGIQLRAHCTMSLVIVKVVPGIRPSPCYFVWVSYSYSSRPGVSCRKRMLMYSYVTPALSFCVNNCPNMEA